MPQGQEKPRSAEMTSRIMARIKSKDSRAEVMFRQSLSAIGIRYRKHHKNLPGCPDVCIVWAKVAVFIDGDFWHGNSWRLRGLPDLASQFPSRAEFWVAKLQRNMERDRKTNRELRHLGWKVLRFWESDVLRDVNAVVRKTARTLRIARDRHANCRSTTCAARD